MRKEGAIVDDTPARCNPWELTAAEVFQLMQAFTRDKTMVTEEDCLTLCRWAQARKLGAYVLQEVLAGRVVVTVEAGVVALGPLAPGLTTGGAR